MRFGDDADGPASEFGYLEEGEAIGAVARSSRAAFVGAGARVFRGEFSVRFWLSFVAS